MQVAPQYVSARNSRPPPLWLVTNGDRTVGPVNTGRLVRGVADGRVGYHCYVRDTRTQAWRPIDRVREVSALGGKSKPTRVESLLQLLKLSEDAREVLELGLSLAAEQTGAEFGLLSCYNASEKRFVVRGAHGPGTEQRRGDAVDALDGLAEVAHARSARLGSPRQEARFRPAAHRLGGHNRDVVSVAMVPIQTARGVSGMIELGRSDHPFRTQDTAVLTRAMGAVEDRLRQLL